MYKLIIISKSIYKNKTYILSKVENEKYYLGLSICSLNWYRRERQLSVTNLSHTLF